MDTEQDFEQDSALVKDLRKQLKAAQDANKAFQDELTEFKSKFRQQTVAEFFQSKGVNPKVAKFVPSDVEGDEALEKWLADNGDVFGAQAPAQQQEQGSPVPTEQAEQWQRASALQERSLSPDKVADLEAKIANANTPQEIDAALAELAKFQL